MDEKQFTPFYKKSSILLGFILSVFLIKQLVMVAVLPIFQAPDEPTHYFRTQYLQEMRYAASTDTSEWQSSGPSASEEITQAFKLAGYPEIGGNKENFKITNDSVNGENEATILKNDQSHYLKIFPLKTLDFPTLYYKYFTSVIENILSDHNILVRFFCIRILSILLGALVVVFAYLTSKKIGLTTTDSILLSAIVSFQPMFSATSAIINPDIMLIVAFAIFTYASVSLLKDSFSWRKTALLLLASVVGILSKGPGIVLFLVGFSLLAYILGKKYQEYLKKHVWIIIISIVIATTTFFIFIPKNYLHTITAYDKQSHFSSVSESLKEYLKETEKSFKFTSLSYWGNFGALETSIPNGLIKFIRALEYVATAGLVYLFFFRKKYPDFLPQKTTLIFLLLLISALQFAIRFYDWRIFDTTGYIIISTPGRYFLPNIIAHMILMVTGLGAFMKDEQKFTLLLKSALILMSLMFLYSIINIIIPSYYL